MDEFRLCYVCSIPDTSISGPADKKRVQIEALRNSGIELTTVVPEGGSWLARMLTPLLGVLRCRFAFRPDWVFFRYDAYVAPAILLMCALGFRNRIVAEVNGALCSELAGWRRAVQFVLDRGLLSRVGLIVVPSQSVGEYVRKVTMGKANIRVLPNPVVTDADFPRDRSAGDCTIVYIGSFQAFHGLDRFLHMLSQTPLHGVHAILAGDGPCLQSIELLAQHVGVRNRVEFTGWVGKARLRDILSRADIGLGSLAIDRVGLDNASSLKVGVYLAYGLPVILGYRDPVLHDQPFVLELLENDPVLAAEQIACFLKRTKEGSLGRQAWEYARSHLSGAVWAQTVLNLMGALAPSGEGDGVD